MTLRRFNMIDRSTSAAAAALHSALAVALLIGAFITAVLAVEELLLVLLTFFGERLPNERHPAVSWLLVEYPRRFVAFYGPKLRATWSVMEQGTDLVLSNEDVLAAVDYTAALIVVTSVFHIIEKFRLAAIRTLRNTEAADSTTFDVLNHTSGSLKSPTTVSSVAEVIPRDH